MKYQFDLYTKFTVRVTIEADSKEDAEEMEWDMYNQELLDPMGANDIETNTEYLGEVVCNS